jgi:TonB-linked SusC/RagA family outer membrane protein
MKKKHLLFAIMRITFLQIALGFSLIGTSVASSSDAQILNKTLSIKAENKEISKVLNIIERAANVTFIYSPVLIQADKKVDVSFRNAALSNILDKLFSSYNIKYEVSGNTIVLNRISQTPEISSNVNEINVESNLLAITGKVTDENGQALIGVIVTVKGVSGGAATDADGNFRINSQDENGTLVFKYIGYTTQEVAISGRSSINVQLSPLSQSLNEVVVTVGYGTQKRATITGAVSSVNAETINTLPVASVEQSLQGRVAGLTVTNNGSPGTSPLVAIRGISSISFASSPLYVIDGFPTGNLASIDTKDIQSVDVLKDASSAAIYGSRGTNGVIIITTKKGANKGKLQVSLDSYIGSQSPSNKYDLLNTEQYVKYATTLVGGAANLPPRFQPANFNQPIYAGSTQTFAQTNTDWQDEYMRKNAMLQQHSLAVSGGNDNSTFYSSAGFYDQDGIAQGLAYKRGNFRINSEHKISKVFTFGQNLYAAQGVQNFDPTQGNRTPLTNVIRMQPYLPVRNPNNAGGFQGPINSFDGADPTNPVEAALIGSNTTSTTKILGTAFLGINLTPSLRFRSTYGIDYANGLTKNYTPIFNDGGTLNSAVGVINNNRQLFSTQLFTQALTFNKNFANHNLTLLAVYESQGQRFTNETASGNQASNLVKTLNNGTNIAAGTQFETNLIQSIVGRVNYDFGGKYILAASLRRDGLSVFAPGHKFENFPSVSAAWKIDQENFMKDIDAISEFKLRAGYGVTGNNGALLGNYPYLQPVSASGGTYPFNGVTVNGNTSFYNGLTNLELAWEKTDQLNVGADLGFFQNRLTVVAEFFKRKTDNLILTPPTPTSFGFGGAGTRANVASMQNTGFELQTGYNKTKGDFKWNVTGLFSVIRNKVLSLNSPNASINAGGDPDYGGSAPLTNTVAGQPVQSFYGYIVDGIFQSAAQVASSPTQPNAAPGDIKFKDLNGDGRISDADRTFIGSFLPDFTYSLNYSASFKNFDMGVFFQGVQGNEIFNGSKIILEGMPRLFNASVNVLNAWTPTNTSTDIPRTISGDPNLNVRPSTRWIEDGSYFRLKNLMFGYNLPVAKIGSLSRGYINRLRIYASSQNLFTVTKYTGLDPEIGSRTSTLTNGIDYGQYPSARSFQFGIQAGF